MAKRDGRQTDQTKSAIVKQKKVGGRPVHVILSFRRVLTTSHVYVMHPGERHTLSPLMLRTKATVFIQETLMLERLKINIVLRFAKVFVKVIIKPFPFTIRNSSGINSSSSSSIWDCPVPPRLPVREKNLFFSPSV